MHNRLLTFFKAGKNLNAIFVFSRVMQLIVYIITYPLLWLISKLPMRLLYGISDLLFLITYYVIGYRKKVVRQNLCLSFPDKSDDELKQIEKKTLRHFVDVFMEMIKSFTFTEKEIYRHLSITNPELLKPYFEKNQSIIIVSGHYANWEWIPFIVEKCVDHHLSVTYKVLKNKYFDQKIKNNRNKFGTTLIPTRTFYTEILNNLRVNNVQAYGFIADQSPKLKAIKHWDTFMGIEVPVIIGPETIARKLNLPVFYFKTVRVKRGVYQSTFVLIAEHPKETVPFEITRKYLNALEDQIKEKPEFYFWTHKRFKHMGKKSK